MWLRPKHPAKSHGAVENHSAVEKRRVTVDLVAYWQQVCAPYIRARFGRDERGASLVEYALLVALIAVVCLVAIAFLGRSASTRFSSVGSSVGSA
jgi:pilus assembly protein Flp/PilA